MKKFLTMAMTGMLVAATAVCFAANGKILDAEESIAEQYAQGGFYKKVSPFMTAELQKSMTETEYVNMQTQMASALGKFTIFKMRDFTRFDDCDVLTYQLVTEKVPVAQFKFIFMVNGDKPLLNDAFIEVPTPKENKDAAPKK
ncbi:MAG: hypothetical protein Q4D21_10360 [Phascolarctobacterium sp.]|nr:hypothetical protein [Phascolarctobacterium sp.]